MPRRRNRKLPDDVDMAIVTGLSHDGRGIVKIDGKTVFVDGALPDEKISFKYTRTSRRHDEASIKEIHEASPIRVTPECKFFDICGGCNLQHIDAEQQIRLKQGILIDNLAKIGAVTPDEVLSPLCGPVWGYRRKARLGVRYVRKKGRVLVGFRERRNRYIADLNRCVVLHPEIGNRLEEFSQLIGSLSIYEHIPQIEVAVADNAAAIIIRHLEPLIDVDLEILRKYHIQTGLHIYLQAAGPESIFAFAPEDSVLSYRHDDYDVDLQFEPSDFTQVNSEINKIMVAKAIEMLELDDNDRVLDLFCGIGNFTLPIAKKTGWVCGIEGDRMLINRALSNARLNKIDNAEFKVSNLFETDIHQDILNTKANKILIDPPRTGAKEIIEIFPKINPEIIVYISCNTSTLARDAGTLVNDMNYHLIAAGVMDMFPHTAHVESIALFKKDRH